MPNTSQWYGRAASGLIANMWTSSALQIGVGLMNTSFVKNIDSASQQKWADVSAFEITGTGYTAGGQIIASKSATYDSTAHQYNLLGADMVWGPGASFTARYGIVYETASVDKWLWAVLDFGGPAVVTSGNFQIDWTGPILSVKVADPV